MGRALYRKYRSKNLSEIVGQEHITDTLNNALKKNTISHAYLFTGPRGVGKTSIARIMAHEVNNLPYDEEATHLDIIEIDAASNRRIDEIRSLRERVQNAPASAKYKVYIIDEVHMLTKEAFNALLKTLEEPPAHAIFILATTEAHKLPDTIISRCIRFTFKPVERSKAVKHLRHIANKENIDISDEALELIAEHGGGSFRDSISLLDQLSNSGAVVDLAAAQRALGIAPDEAIARIAEQLGKGNVSALLETLKNLKEQGYQAPQIAKQLAARLRSSLIEGRATALQTGDITKLLQSLIDVPASHDPDALLEIVLLETTLQQPGTAEPEPAATPPRNEPVPEPEPAGAQEPAPVPAEQAEPEQEKPGRPEPKAPTATKAPDDAAWQQTLKTLKQKYNTLYGIARMAEPHWENGELTLSFKYAFHKKRMDDPKNKQIISDIIAKQTNSQPSITCVVDSKKPSRESSPAEPARPEPDKQPDIEAISNIFGGAEVLES